MRSGGKYFADPVRCVLCGRVAEQVVAYCGARSVYAEPDWISEVDDLTPLCHECALSCYYQGGLYFISDVFRILGYWPEEPTRP
jgi:hypothetical protein